MDDEPILDEQPLPTPAEIEVRLEAWWVGDTERDALRAWAAEIVDRVVFPELPTSDPGAALVELILQLASDLPLARADIPAMRAFLAGGTAAWTAWYAYVAERDWAFRRKHGWRPGK
jgi:hypothetical protein